ncbi:MAG: hypothetical protein WCK39_03870 [Methanomassiliicoccales archaeon]
MKKTVCVSHRVLERPVLRVDGKLVEPSPISAVYDHGVETHNAASGSEVKGLEVKAIELELERSTKHIFDCIDGESHRIELVSKGELIFDGMMVMESMNDQVSERGSYCTMRLRPSK